jgi:DNA-binding XRE family transcriptional regulator
MANRVKPPDNPEASRIQVIAALHAGKLELPEAVKQLRRLTGETQIEFAKRHGVAERTYLNFERGSGNPTWATLKKICSALGLIQA